MSIFDKVSDKCEKQPKNCSTEHRNDSIQLTDCGQAGQIKSRSLIINNPGLKPYHQILVDGCLIQSGGKRCDWMIYDRESEMVCLVELKSSVGEKELKKVLIQFEDTMQFLALQEYGNFKLILVLRKFSNKTAALKLKKEISKKYKGKFFIYPKKNQQGNHKHPVQEDYNKIFPPVKSPSKATP